MRPIAIRLREVVLTVHPQAVEVVRLGDRAATYGLGPRKMSEGYCYVLPHTRWVNLGFYKGAGLPIRPACWRARARSCVTSRCGRWTPPKTRR